MSARRGQTALSGILVIDKPGGMTSHDVVDRVRRITGERRVGHAGTLDPMATGVLVVLVGPATRLASYLTAAEKTYEARIVFGTETDTDDAEGRVVASERVPDEVCDPFSSAAVVASLVGTHTQTPPAFSAIKQGGVTAYHAARNGEALDLAPRTVEVTAARLQGVEIEPPAWDLELTVSKGTYVRALARDLGRACGTVAHLGALRRTGSGSISIAEACTLDELDACGDPARLFVDPVAALSIPVLEVDSSEATRASQGRSVAVDAASVTEGTPLAVVHDRRLIGVFLATDCGARPLTVIPGGVSGESP